MKDRSLIWMSPYEMDGLRAYSENISALSMKYKCRLVIMKAKSQ